MNRAPALVIFLLVFATTAGAAESAALKYGAFDPPRLAPDFALRGSDGSELKLSRYRGKVVALGFGYTSCPDVCPTTLAELAQVRKKLGAAAKDFQVVYITVDPERDSVEQMRKYLAAFDSTFIGATGTAQQLGDVYKAYGILTTKKMIEGSKSYFIHHSSSVYLIDSQGRLREMVPFGGRSIDDIARDVKVLLRG